MEGITIKAVLADPAASFWLKHAIEELLKRDVVDAANDAEVLAKLFGDRADEILKGAGIADRADYY